MHKGVDKENLEKKLTMHGPSLFKKCPQFFKFDVLILSISLCLLRLPGRKLGISILQNCGCSGIQNCRFETL